MHDPSAMNTALSSSGFPAMQHEGGYNTQPPALRPATPTIHITETDQQQPLCDQPLSPTSCDGPLTEWEDFHFPDAATPRRHSHDSNSGAGTGSRGPGKCPSPVRSSPRRHSPVPYSPKRQHRPRHSGSSVASDDCPDLNFSPRCHSPAGAFLPGGDRPCSLPIVPAEEYICVSFNDSSCSPTIARTSQGILSISINGGEDEDVDMDTTSAGERGTNGAHLPFLNHLQQHSDPCSATEQTLRDSCGLFNAGGDCVPFEDTAGQEEVPPGDSEIHKGERVGGVHDQAAVNLQLENIRKQIPDTSNSSQDKCCSDKQKLTTSLEDQDTMDAVSSDETSSDDDMEDLLPPLSQSLHQHSSMGGHTALCSIVEPTCSHDANPSFVPKESTSSSRLDKKDTHRDYITSEENIPCDSNLEKLCEGSGQEDEARGDGSENAGLLGQCLLAGGTAPWRRASCPTELPSRSPCSTVQVSPRRGSYQRASKTPEDFRLSRVVGLPPLHFPHGQGVVVVHCALPSPYDPDLPTPPIILTPHTSYTDLHVMEDVNPPAEDPPAIPDAADKPDIARSKSFPNLNRETGAQFQEPDQRWPALGEEKPEGLRDDACRDAISDSRRGEDSVCAMEDEGPCCSQRASPSLPGSPSSSRAAVIGRLRQVVERRLSGCADAAEALDTG